SGDRDPDLAARQQVLERIRQVVAPDPLRDPGVVEAALVPDAPRRIEDEDVERAGRPERPGPALAVVADVRERVPVLPRPLDHPLAAIVGVQVWVVRVERDEAHATRPKAGR